MGSVIQENDYSIRVKNNSDDEIGVLSQGFNKMLAHIQVNDEQLAFELSERYKAEEHLDKLAYYDVTTDLPNRHFFHKQLDSAVELAITTKQKMVLLFLDLDNFKIVNDTAGHKIGDLLLKQASSRLSNVLRKNDYICRIGGDEFAIIIEDVNDIDNVSIVTKKCIESLSNPFIFDEHKFFIGVSIGVSICPDDTITANDLLVNADMAMYEAKIRGKNNYQYFNQEMNEVHSYKYQLESDLRHAVQKNQMELYYQPQVNADNGSLTGFEALMRWNHPEKGMIKPNEFVPIAEETGLISPLGKWLINTACQHGKQLIASGLENITIGINISAIQLRENTFVDDVTNALKSSGLDPTSLEIELTESILMDDSELVIKKVNQLKSLGIHIAIDDFGTGFSSMSYLKSFPVSKLKIDKSFILGLPKSSEDMAIVRAIIAMAHGLNINVIAEGVERSDQVELLRHYDCDMFQGYYYAKPMAFNDVLKLNSLQKNTNNKLRIVNGK
jgi:diguanylate cyclase (GGDEF)-like protein